MKSDWSASVPAAWAITPLTHEGWPVYQNGFTGELAFEVIQEGRLVALPSEVEAAIRRTFGAGDGDA